MCGRTMLGHGAPGHTEPQATALTTCGALLSLEIAAHSAARKGVASGEGELRGLSGWQLLKIDSRYLSCCPPLQHLWADQAGRQRAVTPLHTRGARGPQVPPASFSRFTAPPLQTQTCKGCLHLPGPLSLTATPLHQLIRNRPAERPTQKGRTVFTGCCVC
jgi:hypothetical protein